jgi:asparagine synthase (glutamine-hydrolysing)
MAGAAAPAPLGRMLELLEHRGPDGVGRFESPQASIGVRRLAIVDIADGRQPALSEDGRVAAVLNGEIYNYRDLRALLERRGHTFRSRSDTEVLPHLYEEFGADMVALLRGMFAIAIWDAREAALLLLRDRMGEKPLFYTSVPGGLVFASELKALLAHPQVGRELDPVALRTYMTLNYVPGPRTIVAGIQRLPAGHRLIWKNGTQHVTRYWDIAGSAQPYLRSRAGAARELRGLLESAVAAQVHADRPLGALLSGGLDSSAIVALMARASPEPPRTFTVGFERSSFDERPQARAVAKALGTQHTELVVPPPSFEDFQRLVRHLDEPVGDQAALPMYLIARTASEHVTVVLTGEGSDELFGGYSRYRWYRLALALQRAPGGVRRPLHRLLAGAGRAREAELMLGSQSALQRHVAWTRVFSAAETSSLLSPEFAGAAEDETARDLQATLAGWSGDSTLEQMMYLDLRTWLVDDVLVKADRMTMASSIEARAPYLDWPLVEFATSLPVDGRASWTTSKVLLRDAMEGLVPLETLQRGKHAFRAPLMDWLRDGLGDPVRELMLGGNGVASGVLDRKSVERLWHGELDFWGARRIWSIAVLELWLQSVMGSPR